MRSTARVLRLPRRRRARPSIHDVHSPQRRAGSSVMAGGCAEHRRREIAPEKLESAGVAVEDADWFVPSARVMSHGARGIVPADPAHPFALPRHPCLDLGREVPTLRLDHPGLLGRRGRLRVRRRRRRRRRSLVRRQLQPVHLLRHVHPGERLWLVLRLHQWPLRVDARRVHRRHRVHLDVGPQRLPGRRRLRGPGRRCGRRRLGQGRLTPLTSPDRRSSGSPSSSRGSRPRGRSCGTRNRRR